MKLNPDCIMDIMLALEDKIGIRKDGNSFRFKCATPESVYSHPELRGKGYSFEEVVYDLLQLTEGGYIVSRYEVNKNLLSLHFDAILYVTPKGHELIASVKDSGTRKKVLSVLKPLGSVSLSIIEAVASGVTDAAIGRLLNQGQ